MGGSPAAVFAGQSLAAAPGCIAWQSALQLQ